MSDLKIPVALVFAMAVQLVALVWYISGLVHDIEHLQGTVSAQAENIEYLNADVNDLWAFCTFTENKWATARRNKMMFWVAVFILCGPDTCFSAGSPIFSTREECEEITKTHGVEIILNTYVQSTLVTYRCIQFGREI
mgnify:CR=1 FL=1